MSSSNPNPLTSKDEDQKRVQFSNPGQRPESPSGPSSADRPPALDIASANSSRQTTSLGGLSATAGEADDDDDGFRTPTDSDHRVPEARPCPPAPRKPTAHPKWRPVKRKNSAADDATWMNHGRRISLLLDLSEEVESMFRPELRDNITCKIKRARTV